MKFYLTADSKFCNIIKFSFISLVLVLGGLCACSSLKFGGQKAQSMDRGLSSSIDRNTIPHLHPDEIFQIKDLLATGGLHTLSYTAGGSLAGAAGGYTLSKILEKVITSRLKPAKVVTQAASGIGHSEKYPVVIGTVGSGVVGGTGGALSGVEATRNLVNKELAQDPLRDQDGATVSDIFLGKDTERLDLLIERPLDRVCAVYHYVKQDDSPELGMQYQEEFKKYAYVQDPKYQEWLERCPEKQQIVDWCKDDFKSINTRIIDQHPIVLKACEQLTLAAGF